MLCCLGFADPPAVATDFDVVVPKSGHPLFGAFQDIMGGGISFVLDSGSTLNIPWEKIKELQLHHKVTNPSAGSKERRDRSQSRSGHGNAGPADVGRIT